MTESRKSKNPLVVGFQGRAQLEDIYGKIAEVMLSQPATKIFMKTTEGKAAEWISDTLGKVEIERLKETHFDGSRAGKNYTIDRQIEPLVMASEISGLEDRRAYLKLGNRIARFDFDYHGLPTVTDAFIPRENAEDKLKFDRRTLEPLTTAASSARVEPPTLTDSPVEAKPEAKEPQEPKQKGGAQYRRALTLAWDGDGGKAKAQTIEQSASHHIGIADVAAEFLQELQQFREALEEQSRDISEDELKAVREEWADIVKRAEEQPEQTTSDPIMLTDLDPYLIPLHNHQHPNHNLPPYDDEQFSLSRE
jgi:hypothetical protein